MTNKLLFKMMILLLALAITAGCSSFAAEVVDEASATEDVALVTEEAAATEDAPDTEEAIATEEVAATEEAAATEEVGLPAVDLDSPLPNNTQDGEYYVTASYASTAGERAIVEPAPDGTRYVLATVTLANESGAELTVAADNIYLIGSDGERYVPSTMADTIRPALVGTTLNDELTSIYGFAMFALPDDVEPRLFEWCPAGDCNNMPLQTPISLQGE